MDTRDAERLHAWTRAVDRLTYYEILGVRQDVGADALTRAFRDFAQVFHPDAHAALDGVNRDALRKVFQHGAEAYKVLSEPALRARYDVALTAGLLRLDQVTISVPPRRPDWRVRLDERCRSAAAKLEAKQGQKLHDGGNLAGAKAALERALLHDGGANLDLQRYIEDLSLRLKAPP